MSDTLKLRILGDPGKAFSRGVCKPGPGSSFAASFAKPTSALAQKILKSNATVGEKFKQEGEVLRQIEAVAATTPAAQQARFDGMTLPQIKRDPLFKMYERSLMARAPRQRSRQMCQRSPRPRARRTSSSSRSSGTDPGCSDSDLPPRAVLGYLSESRLRPTQIRWCRDCHVIAPAVDDYERYGLDVIGFTDRCPECVVAA